MAVPTSECIATYIVHLEGFHVDYERRHNDLIKMDYPLWFVDLENYEPGNVNIELVEMLLDMKECVTEKKCSQRRCLCLHIDKALTPKCFYTCRNKHHFLPYPMDGEIWIFVCCGCLQ